MPEITIRRSRATCDWSNPEAPRPKAKAAPADNARPGIGHNSGAAVRVTRGSGRHGYYRVWIVQVDGRRVDSFLRKANARKKATALLRAAREGQT